MRDEWIDKYDQQFRRALRSPRDQAFDNVMDHCRTHTVAISKLNEPDSRISYLVSICVGQQQQIDELEARVSLLEELVAE